ncbi:MULTISPECIES: hypothetical protein [unclassified Corallococcus]|uniref:hypothetical protein n=2 Tax=Myxococcaceae TaxID=31 RepID=UPI001F2062F4|nr:MULTISPECIES: hypothetical protein [unclassified Corallococcus]
MASNIRDRKPALSSALGAWVLLAAAVAGGCSHAQKPERRVYLIAEDAGGVGGAGGRDCDAEHVACFDRCWNTAPPLTSIKWGSGKHHEYCTEECRARYMDCIEDVARASRKSDVSELRFSNLDGALNWLRTHRTELVIGTVVIIGGVAFVVATGGTGALILAPLAL